MLLCRYIFVLLQVVYVFIVGSFLFSAEMKRTSLLLNSFAKIVKL